MTTSDSELPLPASPRLPTGTLAGLFRNRTNSYKYLFFLSLLEKVESRSSDWPDSSVVSLSSLGAEMLVIAWYPHTLFKLSFGSTDQVAQVLEENPVELDSTRAASVCKQEVLRRHFRATDAASSLLRFVPQRLVRPFFATELRGVPDHRVDPMVVELSGEHFLSRKPLYHFTQDRGAIILHPEWWAYLRDNLPIVRKWALWEWLGYMQIRNPNTPNLLAKLVPSVDRSPLTRQREFWDIAIRHWPSKRGLHSVYSGTRLDPTSYQLDHFVPWAFVAHDRLWNLLPAEPAINVEKSDRVPHPDYVGLPE